MDNRTIDEIRENETKLIIEIKHLEKENQELKEQYNDLVEEKENLQEQLSNSHQIKTKQKEFIEWLEKEIQEQENYAISLGLTTDYGIAEYTSGKIDSLKESLTKYKEIVGGNNDQ